MTKKIFILVITNNTKITTARASVLALDLKIHLHNSFFYC